MTPRKPKPKTQTQQDAITSQRLFKTYGITLEEYDEQLAKQGGVCAICSRPPTNRRLHTDHDHSLQRLRIDSVKDGKVWRSRLRVDIWGIGDTVGRTKSLAVSAIRFLLKRRSCRGLLCATCNRGLRFYRDNPELLRKAAQYLEEHKNVGWTK